jgi:inosine-uridine nucleoside N-ribohydrolase
MLHTSEKNLLPRKILIDTDPGVDDAMAIFYALASPELDVIGITTVFGNAFTPLCTTNALRLLEIAGRTDIPVAPGAERPLAGPFNDPPHFVHGADAQGNANLPPPTTKPLATPAAQFIVEQVMHAPGEITLVTLAPLTNIALALLLEPRLAANLRGLVMMGGNAFVPGNITPAAEANIYNDAEAADVVFGMECPVTMVGLDVTEKIHMSAAELDQIGQIPNPRAQHLARILPFYHQFYVSRYGERGISVHDSTTITYLLAPEIFKTAQHPVRVETTGLSRGKTWPAFLRSDREVAWMNRPKVNICVDVDSAKAIQMELERLSR